MDSAIDCSSLKPTPLKLPPVNCIRTLLPQILASALKNLVLFEVALMLGFPTIAITSLTKSEEGLHFTDQQASWFGGFGLLWQPIGSLLFLMFVEPYGRKRAILLLNIPQFIAWLLIFFATSIQQLFVAAVFLGVGGVVSPAFTYEGEVSQPKWRGVLSSTTGFSVTISYTFVVTVGAVTDWRTTAGICMVFPITAFCLTLIVPESPVWLVSKGRFSEAEQSLCWLRGWVSPEYVKDELEELIAHNFKKSDDNNDEENIAVWRKAIADLRIEELKNRATLQPLLIIIMMIITIHFNGTTAIRPFLTGIFEEFHTTMNPYHLIIIWTSVVFVGNLVCILTVKTLGKKTLSLISLGCCGLFNLSLSVSEYIYQDSLKWWIPSILLVLESFSSGIGVAQVPWMLASEVFPLRGRCIGSAIASTSSFFTAFLATESYTLLHNHLTLAGALSFYALICWLGFIGVYVLLPNTDGKNLQEIEEIFENQYQRFKRKLLRK